MAAGRRRPSEASPSNNAMAADGALKLKHEHRSIQTDSSEGQKKVNMQHTGESPSSPTSRRFCLRTNSDNSSNPLSLATSCHRKQLRQSCKRGWFCSTSGDAHVSVWTKCHQRDSNSSLISRHADCSWPSARKRSQSTEGDAGPLGSICPEDSGPEVQHRCGRHRGQLPQETLLSL